MTINKTKLEAEATAFLNDHPPVEAGNGISQEAAEQINLDVEIEADSILEGAETRAEADAHITDEFFEDATTL